VRSARLCKRSETLGVRRTGAASVNLVRSCHRRRGGQSRRMALRYDRDRLFPALAGRTQLSPGLLGGVSHRYIDRPLLTVAQDPQFCDFSDAHLLKYVSEIGHAVHRPHRRSNLRPPVPLVPQTIAGVGGVARSAVARSPDVKDWPAVARKLEVRLLDVCNRPWGVAVQDDGDVSRHKSVDVLGGLREDAEAFRDHAGAGLL
jgi:hypothetical protein